MHRRQFMRLLSYSLLASGWFSARGQAATTSEQRPIEFVFAQVKYRGGDWIPHPLAVTPLMEEVAQRTSIDAAMSRHEVSLTDRDLFSYPFLYLTGKYEFEPFNGEEIDNLRRFLSFGGFLLIDDALGQSGYGFDKSIRRELQRLFPNDPLKKLPTSHAVMRSYYLLRRIGGVRLASPVLEGITLGSSTPVVYCQNNLGGAWERDQLGKWTNNCVPGGEAQRKDAFHLGINAIVYAMTENYKEDLIHVPFIRRRLTR